MTTCSDTKGFERHSRRLTGLLIRRSLVRAQVGEPEKTMSYDSLDPSNKQQCDPNVP